MPDGVRFRPVLSRPSSRAHPMRSERLKDLRNPNLIFSSVLLVLMLVGFAVCLFNAHPSTAFILASLIPVALAVVTHVLPPAPPMTVIEHSSYRLAHSRHWSGQGVDSGRGQLGDSVGLLFCTGTGFGEHRFCIISATEIE
jgi:hypothetical protein